MVAGTKISMLDLSEKQRGEVQQVVNLCINMLDEAALNQMLGGYQNDIDNLIGALSEEAFRVLYGNVTIRNKAIIPNLERIDSAWEETLRCSNMNYFVANVFDDSIKIGWHHLEWGMMASIFKFISIMASRDHGKSVFFSQLYPIWKLYSYRPHIQRLNHQYGQHFSHTGDFGELQIRYLKEHIEANDILKERLHNPSPRTWKNEEIICKNGAYYKCEGFWSASRGIHPQYIVVDDPFKEEVVFSPIKRERSIKIFYDSIVPMLTKDGQLVVIGTPFHREDLYGTFKTPARRKIWAMREYPAIFPDGKLLWEDRYDWVRLKERKEMVGSLSFAREYLCKVIESASSLFPWEAIKGAIAGMEKYKLVTNIEAFPIAFENVVVGCDFSISANVGSDYTCFTVWGIDAKGCMWLLYIYRNQTASFGEQISELKSINRNFRPSIMVLESNNFQQIYAQHLEGTSLPVYQHTTGGNKVDMKHGIPSLAVMFEQNKFRLPYGDDHSRNMADIILSEFNSFTHTNKGLMSVAPHDDTALSTWFGRLAWGLSESTGFNFAM